MRIRITAKDLERYRIESQEPSGALTEVTVSAAHICEGEGCYSGIADVHAHVTARWTNGAVRREPIALTRDEQREWLLANRPDLLDDWQSGDGWMHGTEE
jgi:hypothetical protein